MDDKLRVGIYGGTFAPLHNGHVEAAKAFMKQMKLEFIRALVSLYLPVPQGLP